MRGFLSYASKLKPEEKLINKAQGLCLPDLVLLNYSLLISTDKVYLLSTYYLEETMTNLDLSPVWISLKTATTATIITFFVGVIAARWMLGYRGKGKGLIDGVLTSPLVLPPTVVGFLLLLLFGKHGPVGQLLQAVDITVIFTWYATVITATVVAFPLMYKTALGAFKQIDGNLLACARTLGASEWTVFWQIMLPLAKPGLIAGVLLAFARALGEFGATLMLAGSIPGRTQTIPIAIFFAAESGAMDQALAWVVVILAISLGVITAVNFWSDDTNQKAKSKRQKTNSIPHSQFSILNSQFSIPHSPIELIVDIQKQLPGFLLDVSFTTQEQPLGLLGASGAGKSIILRCIAGLETPDRGRIILNGRVLFDSQRGINLPSCDRHVGFLFQNYALFPHLTVAQNLAFGLPKGKSALAIKQQVETQLVEMQLQGLGNRYPQELSGGQQQRVALARALASNPEVLLLDEPFSALDTHLRAQIEKLLIASVAHYRGATLFVTHNLEEAYRVCQNLLVIEGGKILAHNPKQHIFERPSTLRVAQLTGCKNFSPAVAAGSQQLKALDWGCTLQVIEPIPNSLSHIGIRAHQLIFPDVDAQVTSIILSDKPATAIQSISSLPLNVVDGDDEEDKKEKGEQVLCANAISYKLVNTFPCWLAMTSETQHRMTLYLKLHQPPNNPQDYHLQAEVFKEKWEILKNLSFPWQIHLHPQRLILLAE